MPDLKYDREYILNQLDEREKIIDNKYREFLFINNRSLRIYRTLYHICILLQFVEGFIIAWHTMGYILGKVSLRLIIFRLIISVLIMAATICAIQIIHTRRIKISVNISEEKLKYTQIKNKLQDLRENLCLEMNIT